MRKTLNFGFESLVRRSISWQNISKRKCKFLWHIRTKFLKTRWEEYPRWKLPDGKYPHVKATATVGITNNIFLLKCHAVTKSSQSESGSCHAVWELSKWTIWFCSALAAPLVVIRTHQDPPSKVTCFHSHLQIFPQHPACKKKKYFYLLRYRIIQEKIWLP